MKTLVGINSFGYRWAFLSGMKVDQFLIQCKTCGAEVVQLCENSGVNRLKKSEIENIYKSSHDLGLEIEYGISGITEGKLEDAIYTAKLLGAKILRAVIDSDGNNISIMGKEIERYLHVLEQQGITLCIENHFKFSPYDIRQLLNDLKSEWVASCLDPLNSIALLINPLETIQILAPFALNVHVKDAVIERFGTGFRIRGVPLGQGVLDIKYLLKSIKNKAHSILIESWMDSERTTSKTLEHEHSWVSNGIQYLKNIRKELNHE